MNPSYLSRYVYIYIYTYLYRCKYKIHDTFCMYINTHCIHLIEMRLAFQTTQEQWLMALSVLSSMEDAAVRPNAISFNSVTQMQKALGREPDAMVNMRHISGIYHQYVINMSSIWLCLKLGQKRFTGPSNHFPLKIPLAFWGYALFSDTIW